MMCYKDMTFCPYYPLCKDGLSCPRALTDQVYADAVHWWGDSQPPIMRYAETPECFKKKEK